MVAWVVTLSVDVGRFWIKTEFSKLDCGQPRVQTPIYARMAVIFGAIRANQVLKVKVIRYLLIVSGRINLLATSFTPPPLFKAGTANKAPGAYTESEN